MASRKNRPGVRLRSSAERRPDWIATPYSSTRSAAAMRYRTLSSFKVTSRSHCHSSGNSMRRSRRRSDFGLGFLTETSGSRGSLWLVASHLVKLLIAAKQACTVRVDRPLRLSRPA